MVENFVAWGVPFFIVAVVAESAVGKRRGLVHSGTMMSDLGAGVISVVADTFLRVLGLGAYVWVFDQHRIHAFDETSPWVWVFALIAVDFIYYWWHRLSHLVNVLWAVHVVHHQSEDFNFAVALRQPALEAISILPFYLPLAAVGVPPVVYAASYAINLFYQFWVHTEFVGKLGPLEWVMNTPSHHRVHHGVNPKYLDRNYAGISILWDRLFGSFQREEEPVVFGVTKPLESYNPLWANAEYWITIRRRMGEAPGLGGKLYALVAHPAWRPSGERDAPPEVSKDTFVKYGPRPGAEVRRRVSVTFTLILAVTAGFFYLETVQPLLALVPLGALIVLLVVTATALVEEKPWARTAERAGRVALVGVALFYLAPLLPR